MFTCALKPAHVPFTLLLQSGVETHALLLEHQKLNKAVSIINRGHMLHLETDAIQEQGTFTT